MKTNRRTFVRIGSAAAVAAAASACKWPWSKTLLTVQIQGLCLVERNGGAVTVHFVDPMKFDRSVVMTGEHLPYLSVLETDLISSTLALTNATFPYVLRLAQHGAAAAIKADPGLGEGVNTYAGELTYKGVAQSHGREWKPVMDLLS